jgi:hypothetical protein
MKAVGQDTLGVGRVLKAGTREYRYFSLPDAYEALAVDASRLPVSLKILLENVLLRTHPPSASAGAGPRGFTVGVELPSSPRSQTSLVAHCSCPVRAAITTPALLAAT